MTVDWNALKWSLICTLLLLCTFSSPTIASADSTTGSLAVKAGMLSQTEQVQLSPATLLSGSGHTMAYSVSTIINDATGSGNGWNLSITSTQFTSNAPTPTTLATNASSIMGVTATCLRRVTCSYSANSATYPLVVPAAVVAPAPVQFFNAAPSSGMGKFTITATIFITLPATTSSEKYSGGITIAVSSGP